MNYNNLIIDLINQIPGDFEKPTQNYKGKQYRSVVFLTDYKIAQFYEFDKKLITGWKKKQIFTSSCGQTYTSMNASMHTSTFLVVYHDKKKIIFEQIKKTLVLTINNDLKFDELSIKNKDIKKTLIKKINE